MTEVLDVVLTKKQHSKLKKYNEFKIPILMQEMFSDNGLPDLQKVQRRFHYEIMNGILSDKDRLLKEAFKSKRDE